MAGAKYGLIGGLAIVALQDWAPQPAGSILFWSLLSIQIALGSWILWRRTGLRFRWFLLSGIAALLSSAAMVAVSTRGLSLTTMMMELPLGVVAAIWLGILFVPLAVGLESQRHRQAWDEWKRFMADASILDVLRFRHIPDLRHRQG